MTKKLLPSDWAEQTKAQRFTRLAEARVSKTLDDLRLISQLAQRTYEHTEAQAETMIDALVKAVGQVASTFQVPLTYRVGKAGHAALPGGIFSDAKVPAHVETSRQKVQVAKALDFLRQNQVEEAKAVLIDLL